MLRRMARRLAKWFNNECLICGYKRVPAFIPFCSEQCKAEHARREQLFTPKRGSISDKEIERLYREYIYYGYDQ